MKFLGIILAGISALQRKNKAVQKKYITQVVLLAMIFIREKSKPTEQRRWLRKSRPIKTGQKRYVQTAFRTGRPCVVRENLTNYTAIVCLR